MSTFAQLCSAVLEESDGRVVDFSTTALGKNGNGELYVTDPTQRNVIIWVRDAYRQVLNYTPYWSFLHKRGLFLALKEGKESYTSSAVQVHEASLYAVTGTTRRPIDFLPYSTWLDMQRSGPATESQTIYLSENPKGTLIAWPIPSTNTDVYGDWWLEADGLVNATDEPVWGEKYHDLLKWMALQKFAAEFSTEGSSNPLMARVAMELPPMWNSFKRQYLPATERPVQYG